VLRQYNNSYQGGGDEMTIIAIIASPRKNGNGNTIVEAMADAAIKNGKDVKKYYLNSFSDAKGCQACMVCKATGMCGIKDDHAEILEAIRKAEGVILATPYYFGEANGQFRLLQDRFYSFLGKDMSANIAPGKKVAVVVTCGSGADGAKALAAKIEGVMVNYFKFESVGRLVFAGAGPPDIAAGNDAILAEAGTIGKKF
jgi:multimeric flavodoxin WrbA